MPKKACRLWLEVTNIRVQRLQDISEEEAIAEGIEFYVNLGDKEIWYQSYSTTEACTQNPKLAFRTLWESIHGLDNWDLNYWCWVVEFRKLGE